MLNKWLLIFSVLAGVIIASSQSSHAQLLQDRNKLKTARRASGFLQSKKKAKIKGPSGKHKTIAAGSVRYSKSQSKVGSSRRVNPKFSVVTAGQVKGRKINPRFTKNNAGNVASKKINPRYSKDNAGNVSSKKVNPRYTQNNAGNVAVKKVNPRYTKTNAGEVKGKSINPRYSQWKQAGKVVVVNPRFSTPPTYSKTKPPGNRKKGFLPSLELYRKPPKHKPGPNSEYAGNMKKKVQKPFHVGNHNQNIKSYKKYTNRPVLFSPSAQMANYQSKTKKMRKGRDMHPSANYLSAKYYKSRTVRDVKRKFNVVWVRMHGNKIQPDAVKKKSKKAKFDKDEIEIWNN
ncbi:MAG: hypothetical protein ABJF11_20185 [Reichenbachiella sp.]|uniref:hypothetical protein n=1 Tax=Reichenbachiella sp. TaxID=2184521 RepID=UPI0032643C96